MESYLSTATGFAILLKQDRTTGVFVIIFQNFQNRYFHLILIVPAPSFLLYLYVGTRRGGGLIRALVLLLLFFKTILLK